MKDKTRRTQTLRLQRDQVSIKGEVEYIVGRAAQHESRAVTLGPLLFFSTDTGDAWVLDPEGQLALCLAVAGEPLPVRIVETAENVAIEWSGTYTIEAEMISFADSSGRVRSVMGYPVRDIMRASRQLEMQRRRE